MGDDRTDREMVDLLHRCLGYQALRGRRDELGLPLREEEVHQLEELERFFAATPSQPADPGLPCFERLDERHPLGLAIEFGDGHGERREGTLRNLSLAGAFVETRHPFAPGDRLSMVFVDPGDGCRWHFSGDVAWVRGGPGGGMGLSFIGIPVAIRRVRGEGGGVTAAA
jgi:hypothetical protein